MTTKTYIKTPREDRKGIEGRLAAIGGDLARTMTQVLNAVPGTPHRPQQLARTLGMNVVMTSRLLKATNHHDPIAVTHHIPGPEPLRKLLKAAKKQGVADDRIVDARRAIDQFETLIREDAGDRGSLDAIISGWLPDARKKVELLSKQSVFRGMSQLLGSAADVEHYTAMLYPSEDGPFLDLLWIESIKGLKRVRPGMPLKFETTHLRPSTPHSPLFTLDGKPVEHLQGLILDEFSSSPPPVFDVRVVGEATQYLLSGEDVGLRSAVDFTYAFLRKRAKAPYRDPDEPCRRAGFIAGIALPVKTLVFDMLLHEDVWREMNPVVRVFRTDFSGVGDPNDPVREIDKLETVETVQFMGNGSAMFRSADTPRYVEIIRHACLKMSWDSEKLRGYRCRIEYPIYTSMVTFGGELADAPVSS